MLVAKFSLYQEWFTNDLVEYLNGHRPVPDIADYSIPWYLYGLSVLPIGIPIMTLGGALPGMIGFGLMAVCFGIAQREMMAMPLRILAILGVTIVGYTMFIGLVIAAMSQQAAG